MEISIGDYVRTISGNIDKVDALYGMIENTIHLENHKWQSTKNIVKHSKDIINLIEVGDYVNGGYVLGINYKEKTINIENGAMPYGEELVKKNRIKSIITKEQIKQIEFRTGERIN